MVENVTFWLPMSREIPGGEMGKGEIYANPCMTPCSTCCIFPQQLEAVGSLPKKALGWFEASRRVSGGPRLFRHTGASKLLCLLPFAFGTIQKGVPQLPNCSFVASVNPLQHRCLPVRCLHQPNASAWNMWRLCVLRFSAGQLQCVFGCIFFKEPPQKWLVDEP